MDNEKKTSHVWEMHPPMTNKAISSQLCLSQYSRGIERKKTWKHERTVKTVHMFKDLSVLSTKRKKKETTFSKKILHKKRYVHDTKRHMISLMICATKDIDSKKNV